MNTITLAIAACSWASPGADPYTGPVPAAVEAYADIPAPVRAKLRQRMTAHDYDDFAAIKRDSISGAHQYTDLRAMHFGSGRLCSTVDRTAWPAEHVERGIVYCEAEHCIIVPTVCRNVARVTRLKPKPEPAAKAPTAATALPALPEPHAAQLEAADGGMGALLPPLASPALPVTFAGQLEPWPMPFAPMPFAPTPPIPEPATWLLMLGGIGLVVRFARPTPKETT